ncbi:hypothetical protein MTBBW1_1630051 [Desulfamplus magnetovallimortis]|uniref:Uncharacterized protein n=1 Tax=Desulfamplus magnetovallimortis TaxID=1246637 RepID=A0A1W1H8Z0_9BACT|nr:hypothetical protein MTBBW1_1630051 [Desulfamplus magnetovallimortis]
MSKICFFSMISKYTFKYIFLIMMLAKIPNTKISSIISALTPKH